MRQDAVESTLGGAFRQVADAVAVPEDPWPGFVRAESRHRRARRVRGAVAAGVVAALVGIQTNVVPLPGWAPGIAIASPASVWADAPPRGSLAHDQAWLDALRRHVGTDTPAVVRGLTGMWEVGDRDQIRLLYGSDVADHRVALLLVPLRFGVLTQWTYVWYAGPAGADARQMRFVGHGEDEDSPVMTMMRASEDRPGGVAVAVGPPDSTVTISGAPRYTAQGTVEYEQLATPDGDGVGVAVLPAAPLRAEPVVEVRRGDEVRYRVGLGGGPYASPLGADDEEIDRALAAAEQQVRGTAPDRGLFRAFVDAALQDSRLSLAGTTVRLRWSGTVAGQPAALFTLQPDGGGVIAYAVHGTERSGWWTDLRLLVPAEGADRRPFGWRLRAEGADGRTDQVVVATPAGTATASVVSGAGPAVPVALDPSGAGRTTVPVDQPATVTAYAADGSVLGSTPIPPVENDLSGLPGTTPQTRVVG